jgi:hypothetical protein
LELVNGSGSKMLVQNFRITKTTILGDITCELTNVDTLVYHEAVVNFIEWYNEQKRNYGKRNTERKTYGTRFRNNCNGILGIFSNLQNEIGLGPRGNNRV